MSIHTDKGIHQSKDYIEVPAIWLAVIVRLRLLSPSQEIETVKKVGLPLGIQIWLRGGAAGDTET